MNAYTKLILSGLALCFATSASAQRRPDLVPTLTVMTFQSDEIELGAKFADMLRDRISGRSNSRTLNVIPGNRINSILEESGYDPAEPLPRNDEIQLGVLLNAHEFVTGSINRPDSKGPYIVKAYLAALKGKEAIMQPLPVIEESRLNRAADRLREVVEDARKQLEGERACNGRALSGRAEADSEKRADFFRQALEQARRGVEQYPQATIARVCITNVFFTQVAFSDNREDSLAYADSALVAAAEVLEIDSFSIPALSITADLSRLKGDEVAARSALIRLVQADPQNTSLVERVVNELAASGNSKEAVPMVREMLDRSPGDAQVLRTAFLVFLDAGEYKEAVQIGPELIKVDTSEADTLYFIRMSQAYTSLEESEKAIETLAAGSARFPSNQTLMFFHSIALTKSGKTVEGTDILRRLVALNPAAPEPLFLLLNQYMTDSLVDSVAALIDRASASDLVAEHKTNLGKIALRFGQLELTKVQQDFSDTAAISRAERLGTIAEKVDGGSAATYIVALSHLFRAQAYAQAAAEPKSCSLAQSGKQSLNQANTLLTQLQDDDLVAGQVGGLKNFRSELLKAIDSMVSNFCK